MGSQEKRARNLRTKICGPVSPGFRGINVRSAFEKYMWKASP